MQRQPNRCPMTRKIIIPENCMSICIYQGFFKRKVQCACKINLMAIVGHQGFGNLMNVKGSRSWKIFIY